MDVLDHAEFNGSVAADATESLTVDTTHKLAARVMFLADTPDDSGLPTYTLRENANIRGVDWSNQTAEVKSNVEQRQFEFTPVPEAMTFEFTNESASAADVRLVAIVLGGAGYGGGG